MDMTMTREQITPEKAKLYLNANKGNRKISKGKVKSLAQDILAGNWKEKTGDAITFDEDGILRNGQHRLSAIVEADKPIETWVCRNAARDGVYDMVRPRNARDQMFILRPDFDGIYRTPRYIAVARAIIGNATGGIGRAVTPMEIIDFTEKHKKDLDVYFTRIPQTNVQKINLSVVHLSLFMAYMAGEDINKILEFYDILVTGMSTKEEEFPAIAYRNYLKDSKKVPITNEEIRRCQYALKNYLKKTCIKKSISPKKLIWPFPYTEETE